MRSDAGVKFETVAEARAWLMKHPERPALTLYHEDRTPFITLIRTGNRIKEVEA